MPLSEPAHFDHNELFTGPIREHVVGAKAATLILKGVITTGQPADAASRQPSRSASSSGQQGFGFAAATENGETSAAAPVATPANQSGRMAALFANLPTPAATPSPTSGPSGDESSVKGNGPPSAVAADREKPQDKRLGPNGPRPMMRRVVSATGVGLGVKGRGLNNRFTAAARDRAASANVTVAVGSHGMNGAGVGGGVRRRSSRLMNLYNSNSSPQGDNGHDDNDSNDGGGPSKKAKKK